MVAVFFQTAEQVGFPGFDEVFETAVAADVWVGSGEHAAAGLRADGGLGEAVCE